MLRLKPNLIPRANWDYGIFDFGKSVSGIFNGGLDMEASFERIFNCTPIFTTSGRASLYAILTSLDLPPGSRVGVPLFCCSVVFDTILKAGFRPQFLDIDPEDFNISPADLERKKASLSAVIVVHMFGTPADMESISAVSGDRIPVIEDCAHSLFSRYRGRYTGTLSTASFFSFRSGKYISSGEGSAILTRKRDLYEQIKRNVRTYPSRKIHEELIHATTTLIKSKLYQKPYYGLIGLPLGRLLDKRLNLTAKSGIRLTTISKSDTAIISDRIANFHACIEQQQQNANYLLSGLSMKNCIFPAVPADCESNSYQFPIRFKSRAHRDTAADVLLRRGIDCAKYLDEIVDYAKATCGYEGDCRNAELRSKTTLLLPHYYTLSSETLDRVKRGLIEIDPLLK